MLLASLMGTAYPTSNAAGEPDPIVTELQDTLTMYGYDPGPVDGYWGPNSKRALLEYQNDHNLPVTGCLDTVTSEALGIAVQEGLSEIVGLLQTDKIEIETQGSGIQSIAIRLLSKVPYRLKVLVPLGTEFVASSASVQNMITTRKATIPLDCEGITEKLIEAACGNIKKDIPNTEDTFSVRRTPNQESVEKLLRVLNEAFANYAVRQAAIWIVTDDANYADLGVLVERPHFQMSGGTRVIGYEEAAEAMRLCDEAGIDLSRKAIWNDRRQIMKGLPHGELRTWLERKV